MRVFVLTKRTLLLIGIAAVAIIAVLLFFLLWDGGAPKKDRVTVPTMVEVGGVEEYELEVLAGKMKELPVYNVQRDDNKIALTIDAAWEDDKTDFILEELNRQGIKATFYLCGEWVDKYPQHVREIYNQGHELGNHTNTHPHMNRLDAKKMEKEIKELDDKIEKITGQRSKTFRAPFGEYNDLVITTTRAQGYEVVQWNIDTLGNRWKIMAQYTLSYSY